MRPLLFPIDQPAQTYRIKRLLFALLFYVLCELIMGFGAWHGFYPTFPLTIYMTGFVAGSAAFYAITRMGWNLRFRDPSMTQVQIAYSAVLCSYILVYAGQLRGVFMLAYVIGLMFAGTQVGMRQLARLALLPLMLYPLMAFIASRVSPLPFDWRVEFVNWISLCVVLGFTAVLVGNLRKLQARLKASNAELESALARLTEMAVHDDLTGLFNRRHMLDMLEREKSRTDRSDGGFCVCVIDIDHFKRVNDTYGHGDGDTVLRTFAKVAEQGIRTTDILARWGGEEFLLLLPQTPVELAESCVERIKAALERTAFDGLPPDLRVTISAGIAQYRSGALKDLIEQADKALYSAKRAGRNRIVKAEQAVTIH